MRFGIQSTAIEEVRKNWYIKAPPDGKITDASNINTFQHTDTHFVAGVGINGP